MGGVQRHVSERLYLGRREPGTGAGDLALESEPEIDRDLCGQLRRWSIWPPRMLR